MQRIVFTSRKMLKNSTVLLNLEWRPWAVVISAYLSLPWTFFSHFTVTSSRGISPAIFAFPRPVEIAKWKKERKNIFGIYWGVVSELGSQGSQLIVAEWNGIRELSWNASFLTECIHDPFGVNASSFWLIQCESARSLVIPLPSYSS